MVEARDLVKMPKLPDLEGQVLAGRERLRRYLEKQDFGPYWQESYLIGILERALAGQTYYKSNVVAPHLEEEILN